MQVAKLPNFYRPRCRILWPTRNILKCEQISTCIYLPSVLNRYSGSVIMSAMYSYEASRRDNHMIERMMMGLDLVRKEMKLEAAAVFSAYSSRRSRRLS